MLLQSATHNEPVVAFLLFLNYPPNSENCRILGNEMTGSLKQPLDLETFI